MEGGMKEMLARALLGNGMAGQGADTLQAEPAYKQYAEQAMSQGEQPIPFEQWMQQFMGQGQMQGGMPQGQMPQM